MRHICKATEHLKVSQAIKILKMLYGSTSLPFRFPVDTSTLYDYDRYIKEDHCLMSILENLNNGLYGRGDNDEVTVSSVFIAT